MPRLARKKILTEAQAHMRAHYRAIDLYCTTDTRYTKDKEDFIRFYRPSFRWHRDGSLWITGPIGFTDLRFEALWTEALKPNEHKLMFPDLGLGAALVSNFPKYRIEYFNAFDASAKACIDDVIFGLVEELPATLEALVANIHLLDDNTPLYGQVRLCHSWVIGTYHKYVAFRMWVCREFGLEMVREDMFRDRNIGSIDPYPGRADILATFKENLGV
jgi:hypothetical protein